MFPFIKLATVLQSVEDVSQVQLAFEYIQNILLFLGLILAIIVMILIPIILCFGMIDNYFALGRFKNKIDHDTCLESKSSTDRVHANCRRYIKVYSRFLQYTFGLAAWNLFSLIYILIGYSDFKSGLIAYFNFPLEVLGSLDQQNLLTSFSNFDLKWYYMLGIVVLTIACLLIGRNIGDNFGKHSLKQQNLNVVLN